MQVSNSECGSVAGSDAIYSRKSRGEMVELAGGEKNKKTKARNYNNLAYVVTYQ